MAKKLEETVNKRQKIEEAAKDDAMHIVSGEGLASSSAAATAGASLSSSGGPQNMQRNGREQYGGGGEGTENKKTADRRIWRLDLENRKGPTRDKCQPGRRRPKVAMEYMVEETGEHSDRVLVDEARQEEISCMRRIGLHELYRRNEWTSTKDGGVPRSSMQVGCLGLTPRARSFETTSSRPCFCLMQRSSSSKWPHRLGKRRSVVKSGRYSSTMLWEKMIGWVCEAHPRFFAIVWNVRCVVRDFTTVGPEMCLKEVLAAMGEWYLITVKGIFLASRTPTSS